MSKWSKALNAYLIEPNAKGFEVVRRELEAGANPNEKIDGFPAVVRAAQYENKQLMHALIDAGAKVAVPAGKGGRSLLHLLALELRDVRLVEKVVARGADVNARDKEGMTPLHFAVLPEYMGARYGGSLPLTTWLLEHGADIDAKNGKGQTALHLVCVSDGRKLSPARAQSALLLIERGADVNAVDKEGQTPLSSAAQSQALVVVKALLKKKAKPKTDKYGNTPLHFGIMYPDDPFDPNVIKVLVEAGCDVNTRNKDGLTPFLQALPDHPKLAKAFAVHGAKKSVAFPDGETAIEWAEAEDDSALVSFLKRTLV